MAEIAASGAVVASADAVLDTAPGKVFMADVSVPDCVPMVTLDHTVLPADGEVEITLELVQDNGAVRLLCRGRVDGKPKFGIDGKPLTEPVGMKASEWHFHTFTGTPEDKDRLVIPGPRPANRPDFPLWAELTGEVVHFIGTQQEYDSNYELRRVPIEGKLRVSAETTKGAPKSIPVSLRAVAK